jgi:two-component system, sensor histidine kinase RegB
MNSYAYLPAPHQILKILCLIRTIPLMGMFIGLYYLLQQQTPALNWHFIFLLLAVLIAVIGLTWLRSMRTQGITEKEIFTHLALDIALYSLLMFNTGGAANPFISYLLVPVTIAAITLPATLTWLTGALCLACYTMLLFWFIPVALISPGHSGHHDNAGNIHLLGMWLNFVVSTGLIAFFVNRMAQSLKRQQQALTAHREQRLEDDQLLAVATLAASAAHELGTPLNSIKLICEDWQEQLPEHLKAEGRLLNSQIDRCRQTLHKLSGRARSFTNRDAEELGIGAFFRDLVDTWQVMRPDAHVDCKIEGKPEAMQAQFHPALTPCLQNLLNNAADASPHHVDIHVHWTEHEVQMVIEDRGPGIDLSRLEQPLQGSEKPMGMGLGLYLSRSILARHNGSMTLENRDDTGTRVIVVLPLSRGVKAP